MPTFALVVALTLAAPPVAAAPDGAAAFEKLKKLEGSWKTEAKDGPAQYVTLRFIGAGISMLETSTGADRATVNAAVVYTFEGTRFVVLHYGGGGTSRLELAASPEPGVLRFESATRDSRVASLTLVLKENKLRQEWTTREGGREVKKALELQREYLDTLK